MGWMECRRGNPCMCVGTASSTLARGRLSTDGTEVFYARCSLSASAATRIRRGVSRKCTFCSDIDRPRANPTRRMYNPVVRLLCAFSFCASVRGPGCASFFLLPLGDLESCP